MPGIAHKLIRATESLGVSAVSRLLHSQDLLIVMYHGIMPESRDWEHWCQIPADEFRWQIQYLKKHYEILPLSDIVDRLTNSRPLPPNCAALTFDDGLQNNFEVAFPILRELGVPATMYLATGYVGTDKLLWQDRVFAETQAVDSLELDLSTHGLGVYCWDDDVEYQSAYESLLATLKRLPAEHKNRAMRDICRQTPDIEPDDSVRRAFQIMTWDNAAEMQASGLIEIGPHTVNHEILSRLSDERVEAEIVDSYEAVLTHLGISSSTFAFPNGTRNDFDARVMPAFRQCQIKAAVTTVAGLNSRSQPLFNLKRVGIGSDTSRAQFRAEVSGLMDRLRKFRPTQSVLHDPACGPTSVADSVQDLAATTNLATASSR
ncbi:MAG: polysaccharide deacetylase family protein [Planctomycetota bacterium]|nr:polysaccharide deacetylase family protein [Planctomycetota bacterium]